MNDYFGRTLVTVNKIRIHREQMDDVVIIEKNSEIHNTEV